MKVKDTFCKAVLLVLLALSLPSFAQNDTEPKILEGWVLDGHSKETILGVHVINKRTLKGTVTDVNGYFEIKLEVGDSIIFSNIAYKYFYFIYSSDSINIAEVVVAMEEQNYLLDQVSVFSYELSANKARAMKLLKPNIPSNSEIKDPQLMKAGMDNPAEYLYNLFGKKPRQLRRLAELKAEDAYRERLDESDNRRAVMRLTGLQQEELEAFMFYCKYVPVNMNRLNDYEFLIAVQACFRRYMNYKELEGFLEQFD